MNIKNNERKKELLLEMCMEIAEIQKNVSSDYAKKFDYLLRGFLNLDLKLENALKYIEKNILKSSNESHKIIWLKVLQIIQTYFTKIKKIK
jgi:hypothetical protein